MKSIFKMDRKQFIKGILGAGVFSFFPTISFKDNEHPFSQQRCIKSIKKVINEQGAFFDYKLGSIEILHIEYAVEKIKPKNHVELAFVVACSWPDSRYIDFIDEYVRRKKGEKSLIPDHPILSLERWGRPDTQRILIFKEQIQTLLRELTGVADNYKLFRKLSFEKYSKRHIHNHYRGVSLNEFTHELTDDYKNKLTPVEINTIYDALISYAGSSLPYAFCSTMATRASILESQAFFGEL